MSKFATAKRPLSEPVEGIAGVPRQAQTLGDDNPAGSDSETVYTDATPSGLKVSYRPEQEVNGVKLKRQYWVNAAEVPSVTEVLDVLAKGGLTIWGMRVGIKGVLELFNRGIISPDFDWDLNHDRLSVTAEQVEELMKQERLTTTYVVDQAADRGLVVHKALEDWVDTGQHPLTHVLSAEEQGYCEGLYRFIEDAKPAVVHSEVMVGSEQYGFAGRFDLAIRIDEPREVNLTPKRKKHVIPPGVYLTDLKTSKSVYDTNFLQLAAYEGAARESGYPATDGQAVLRVTPDGSYQFVFSKARYEHFLAVKGAYDALAELKAAKAA